MKKVVEVLSAIAGAIASFFCSVPPVVWILIAVMSLDFITGLITGALGKSDKTETGGLSSATAFKGLMKKILIILAVGLSALIDWAIASTADIQFTAILYATCLWFIASEGMSIVENMTLIGIPIPKILKQALEVLRKKGDGIDAEPEEPKNEKTPSEDEE